MKSKGSASLYEVLKSASGRPETPGAAAAEATPPPGGSESGGPTLQERLAAYKAAKLAAVTQPPAAPAILAAAPKEETPAPAPLPSASSSDDTPAPSPSKGPGERVLRLTCNTAVFAGLVVLGLVFVAYAIGVQTGRKRALETAAVEPPVAPAPTPEVRRPAPPPPPPPPPAPKEYTIRLAEWKYGNAQERLKADVAADDYRRALDRANFRGSKKEIIQRAGEPRLALYIDSFADPAAATVRTRFAALQKVKVGTQYPFAQAQIEETPK